MDTPFLLPILLQTLAHMEVRVVIRVLIAVELDRTVCYQRKMFTSIKICL